MLGGIRVSEIGFCLVNNSKMVRFFVFGVFASEYTPKIEKKNFFGQKTDPF